MSEVKRGDIVRLILRLRIGDVPRYGRVVGTFWGRVEDGISRPRDAQYAFVAWEGVPPADLPDLADDLEVVDVVTVLAILGREGLEVTSMRLVVAGAREDP